MKGLTSDCLLQLLILDLFNVGHVDAFNESVLINTKIFLGMYHQPASHIDQNSLTDPTGP